MIMSNEQEILRDIPLLHQKVGRCNKAILDLERSIMQEEHDMMALKLAMGEDEVREAQGKRRRYEQASMLANIERHQENIKMFRESISKENETIKKTMDMIAVLEEDLKRPTEIVLDMSGNSKTPRFRDYLPS